jgi:hypothetical protein
MPVHERQGIMRQVATSGFTPFERMQGQHPERIAQALAVARALHDGSELPPLPPPLQIEVHPGTGCPVHCPHCTGRNLRRRPSMELALPRLVSLVEGMRRHSVGRLTLSGIYTDPLSYSALVPLLACSRRYEIAIGVHSKLVQTSPGLLEELSDPRHLNGYIHISIDHWAADVYQRALHPERPDALRSVLGNTEALCARVEANRSPLSVGIVTLLHPRDPMADLEAGADFYFRLRALYQRVHLTWRLSIPWMPTSRLRLLPMREHAQAMSVSVSPGDLRRLRARVSELADGVRRLPGHGRVSFRDNELSAMPCAVCLNALLFGAVGTCGGYYPCQGVASPEYAHLSYGNLHRGDDFFERWFARGRAELGFAPGVVCPACAAPTEREVNVFGRARITDAAPDLDHQRETRQM